MNSKIRGELERLRMKPVHYSHVYTRIKEAWTRLPGGESLHFVCLGERTSIYHRSLQSLDCASRRTFMTEVYERLANGGVGTFGEMYMNDKRTMIRLDDRMNYAMGWEK